jgi:MoaA/NifB/PqqE/SkfB family radical SAM enzyme
MEYNWTVSVDNKFSYENFLSSSSPNPLQFSIFRPLCFFCFPRYNINEIPNYELAKNLTKDLHKHYLRKERFLVRNEVFGTIIYDKQYLRYYLLNETLRDAIISKKINGHSFCHANEILLILSLSDIPINLLSDSLLSCTEKMDQYYNVPLKVFFEITNYCNMQCLHCLNKNTKTHVNMRTEKIFSYLDQLYALKVAEVNITGGEPFMHPDIIKIITYAMRLFPGLTISTNGKLLNTEFLQLLQNLDLQYLNISLDGNEKYHNQIRKGSDYLTIVNNINLAKRYINNIGITITLNKYNINVIDDIIEMSYINGIKKINFGIIKKSYFNKNDELLISSSDELFEAIKNISFLCDTNNISCYLPSDLPFSSIAAQKYNNCFIEQLNCSAGEYFLKILANETAAPCIFREDIPLININNNIEEALIDMKENFCPSSMSDKSCSLYGRQCLGGCIGRFCDKTMCDQYCMRDKK